MDPQTQEFNPAPASPLEVGSTTPPVMGAQGEMSQEEMKANLQELMAKIKGRYNDFNAQNASSAEASQEQKDLALREVFDLFQKMGIDPSDVQQVREFLDKIKVSNPELSAQIEKALESLIEGEDISTIPGGEVPPEDMNINNNESIQQNL